MRTILLRIEYDGTRYAGWQIQKNGLGVQGIVEAALTQVVGHAVRIHSSGRTDAGVHAHDMPAHFRTEVMMPLSAFREGVNRFLPEDVAVREVLEVPDDFHARYSARGKWYRYTIYRGATRSPLACRVSWHMRGDLDLELMRAAADMLVGEHDFQAFRTSGCAAQTTIRTIFAVDFVADGDFLHLDFKGTGFLRNMVRLLVGTLVDIGRGKRPIEELPRLLAVDPDVKSGPTAPPQGLCLRKVWYDFDASDKGFKWEDIHAADRRTKNPEVSSESP